MIGQDRKLEVGQTIGGGARRLPRRRLVASALAVAALGLGVALAPGSQAAEPPPSLAGVVNVNTATPEQLQLLPGVGESRAAAIVAERKRRGGFKRVEDLEAIRGIGEAMLKKMRPNVVVSGKTTARALP